MSVGEDSTFCHYCGRKAGPELQLHWDHVPALNVKVPPEYMHLIKKTLVRACSECNTRASDHPHMEYIDRHIWLKHEYLKAYKKILLSGKHDPFIVQENDLLAAYINNSIVRYEDILHAIGFGLADLSQINSPILSMKDNNGNYIRDVLNKYLSLPILKDDSDEFGNILPSLDEFFVVLFADFSEQPERLNKKNYDAIYQRYGYRVESIIMPRKPDIEYSLTWENMRQIIEYIAICKEQEKTYYIEDLIDLLNQDKNQAQSQSQYCTYGEFIDELANVMSNGVKNPITGIRYNFRVERDFETWYENHKSLLNQIGIPALPCYVYKKKWADIGGDITTLFIAQSSSEDNIFEEENEIRKFYNNPERKITEAKATISEAESRISESERKISEANARISESERKISEANARISEAEATISEAKARISESKAKISEAEASISEAEAKIRESEIKISKPEAKISESEIKLSEPETKISKPEAKISKSVVKISKPEAKISKPAVKIIKPEVKISKREAKIIKPKTKVINWVNYFEERIKFQLPGNAKITKSFFKERENNNLGNLVRFVIETNRKKESIVDCYENGTVSIDVYDFSKHDQIFICYSVPSEIQKTIQGFNSLIELMK